MHERFYQFSAAVILAIFISGSVLVPSASAQTASNAIQKCTVSAVTSSVGGTILNAAKDIGKGILKVAEGLPGVGTLVSGAKSVLGGIGSFLGIGGGGGDGKDEVQKVEEQKKDELKRIQLDACINAIQEQAFKVALAKLQKRLLDRMTDDIIGWISDGRDPKFITDFGGYLEDAAQAAVGDTARALGLAELCAPFKYRLPPLLTPVPTFSRQVSCTLDDIVQNIEGFYEDFSSGGFLAYAEAWKPNNNPLGVLLATQDEVLQETAKKKEAATLVAASSGGFKPVYQCLEWTVSGYKLDGNGKATNQFYSGKIAVDDNFPYRHPDFPPVPESESYQHASNAIFRPTFECSKKEITLPPGGTQQIASVALTADTQVVANADDLSPYVNAIFDAAVNRIIKEGVKGLRGNPTNLRSESGTGRAPQPYNDDDRYRDYGEEYSNATNLSRQMRTEIQAQLTEAERDVQTASSTLVNLVALNRQFITTTTQLSGCETSRLGSTCENTSSSLAIAGNRTLQLASDRDSLTQTLASIEEVRGQLTANPNLPEGDLRALLTVVNSVRDTLQITTQRFAALEILLEAGLDYNRQAFQACQTSSYSCTWTPPPPSS
jgi:hypothetical protein